MVDVQKYLERDEVTGFDVLPSQRTTYVQSGDLYVGGEQVTGGDNRYIAPAYHTFRESVCAIREAASGQRDVVEYKLEDDSLTAVVEDRGVVAVYPRPGSSDLAFTVADGNLNARMVDLSSGDTVQLTETPDLTATMDWAPDGERFVFQQRGIDSNLYVTSVDSPPSEYRPLVTPEDATATISIFGSRVYTANSWGKERILFRENSGEYFDIGIVSPGADPEWVATSDVEKYLFGWVEADAFCYAENDRGNHALVKYDLTNGERTRLVEDGVVKFARSTEDGLAYLYQRHDQPQYLRHPASPQRDSKTAVDTIDPEYVEFTARDGARIPAILYDGDTDRAAVYAHGGPPLHMTRGYNGKIQTVANHGLTVLCVDYRGSDGYGRTHQQAIVNDVGGVNVTDVIDGSEYLKQSHGYDSVGIFGRSFGGYTTLMAITQSDTFDAACSVAGIASLSSTMRNANQGLTQTLGRLLPGSPEECPEFYTERSPITHADYISTPLLLIHGENDPQVPGKEIEEFVQRMPNETPVETHWFDQPHQFTGDDRVQSIEMLADFLTTRL